MLETWRWFGPNDSVTLSHIKQAGAKGIVTSLHQIPTGDVWTLPDILARKQIIEDGDLEWSVIESVPLHNDIKLRTGDFEKHIENYKTTIKNVGEAGIKTICYNFMPVVDWTRTNLSYALPNQAKALRFENIIAGLPGGEGSYSRESIREAIAEFIQLGNEGMRRNLILFLEAIIPTAESVGVKMCIHPDDPPFSLFGLPRVVSTADDARQLLNAVPSKSNGLTLCAGSFGARCDNDLVAIAKEFAAQIHFVHLRNVKRESDGSFYESEHLDGDNDMIGLINALLDEQERRKAEGRLDDLIPMRPDHGHLMSDELTRDGINPGYSFAGRLKGLAELRGVIVALSSIRA